MAIWIWTVFFTESHGGGTIRMLKLSVYTIQGEMYGCKWECWKMWPPMAKIRRRCHQVRAGVLYSAKARILNHGSITPAPRILRWISRLNDILYNRTQRAFVKFTNERNCQFRRKLHHMVIFTTKFPNACCPRRNPYKWIAWQDSLCNESCHATHSYECVIIIVINQTHYSGA